MGIEDSKTDPDINQWLSELVYDQWAALPVPGSRPSARYKHAATVDDGSLYVVGGSRNGRYLSDIQVLNLDILAWSTLKIHADPDLDKLGDDSYEVLPATSGHSLVKWGSKLLLLGGNSKESAKSVTVRSFDLETHHCVVMKTAGEVPIARSGQSVALVGSRLIMFGGEDTSKRLLNDVHVLDLDTMTWDVLKTMHTPPSPRFDHTAAVHAQRYLLIFGGCSHSTCFNDLHILDLQTLEWSQPQTQGDVVRPRAGHAGVTMDENWYIVGGGDNISGASETLVLNMSKLVWSVLTTVNQRDPLASEGLSLCSTVVDEEKLLLAFGGYYGKYSNEVFLLRPKPRDASRPKIFQSPAAAAAAASVTAAYALNAKGEKKLEFTNIDDENHKRMQRRSTPQDFTVQTNAITTEKKMLESSLSEVRTENMRQRGLLDEMNTSHTELSKELLSVKGQLAAEVSRCSKLEAQIAELRKRLESLQSIEGEVNLLRNQKAASDRDAEFGAGAMQRQSSGGVWQWFGGGTNQ